MVTSTNKGTQEEIGARSVYFEADMLIIELSDDRLVGLPFTKIKWLEWLAAATPEQRSKWSIEPYGYAIWWDELDDGFEVAHALSIHPLPHRSPACSVLQPASSLAGAFRSSAVQIFPLVESSTSFRVNNPALTCSTKAPVPFCPGSRRPVHRGAPAQQIDRYLRVDHHRNIEIDRHTMSTGTATLIGTLVLRSGVLTILSETYRIGAW